MKQVPEKLLILAQQLYGLHNT